MAMPPMPMPGAGAPGAPPKPPGAGMAPGPIGGPAGPGASPMVSPGTGAGMQARATQGIGKVIETLMEYGSAFEPGTAEFNGIMGAIRSLNQVAKGARSAEGAKAPLPVPAAAPGGGLGGVGAPPTGLPAGGAGPGGAGPIEPPM